jgi:hypothetical protein
MEVMRVDDLPGPDSVELPPSPGLSAKQVVDQQQAQQSAAAPSSAVGSTKAVGEVRATSLEQGCLVHFAPILRSRAWRRRRERGGCLHLVWQFGAGRVSPSAALLPLIACKCITK